MSPRYHPVAIALNETQIIIMGGHNHSNLSDILIFDTSTKTITTKVEDIGFKFKAHAN